MTNGGGMSRQFSRRCAGNPAEGIWRSVSAGCADHWSLGFCHLSFDSDCPGVERGGYQDAVEALACHLGKVVIIPQAAG